MTDHQKKAILDNIAIIPAEELFASYILTGDITLSDMMHTGNLEASKRRKIEELITKENAREEEAWTHAKTSASIDAYNDFLREFPHGNHSLMAEALRDNLIQVKENSLNNKKHILDKIKYNSNDEFTPKVIKDLIDSKEIALSDLKEIGIPEMVLDKLMNFREPVLTLGIAPESIPDGYTEVYFWGSPGSGKTCALSGILSYMHNDGIFSTDGGSGYHYMNQLTNIFSKEIGALPAATTTEVTQYLPFKLTDDKKEKHPIALIELSGEIFECYYYMAAGLPLPSTKHVKTFETLTNYLAGPNKKVHFFVIDLSKDPHAQDEKGMCLYNYLDAAQKYFKNTDIFRKSTDALYIIATKSDLLNCHENQRLDEAAQFLKNHYAAFVNVLKDACATYKINDNNELKVIPFSLGNVYFNKICQFNSKTSRQVVQILQQKTAKEIKRSGLGKFLNS